MLPNKNSLIVILFLCLINAHAIQASDNHYLSLKTDNLIELELEKLATIAKMPVLSKPYHIATVKQYLELVRDSHPQLYYRIKSYLTRYKSNKNITQLDVEVSYNDYDFKGLANARGRTTNSNLRGHIAGYWQLADNVNLSIGGTIYDGSDGFIPHNTYISYSGESYQIDLGYKELWLSPLQESAMLLSTNAKPIARISVSSPMPLTDWKFEYDISYGKFETQQGIRLGEETFSGRPGFLSMHFSVQPVNWWTLGINRTLTFGGGQRSIGAGDVWQAIIDPVNGDNCGGASELQNCEDEAGNQQASLTSKFDFNWGMPVNLYFEYGGEDTRQFKAYKLGNKAYSVGIFLPYLTNKSTFLLEYQIIENGWYTHHIYFEGYRNDLRSMGHWWGDEKLFNDGIGTKVLTLRYTHKLTDHYHLDLKFASINNANIGDILEAQYDESIYQAANQLTIGVNQIENNSNWRYELYIGSDVFGENFNRFSIAYRWK